MKNENSLNLTGVLFSVVGVVSAVSTGNEVVSMSSIIMGSIYLSASAIVKAINDKGKQ